MGGGRGKTTTVVVSEKKMKQGGKNEGGRERCTRWDNNFLGGGVKIRISIARKGYRSSN